MLKRAVFLKSPPSNLKDLMNVIYIFFFFAQVALLCVIFLLHLKFNEPVHSCMFFRDHLIFLLLVKWKCLYFGFVFEANSSQPRNTYIFVCEWEREQCSWISFFDKNYHRFCLCQAVRVLFSSRQLTVQNKYVRANHNWSVKTKKKTIKR